MSRGTGDIETAVGTTQLADRPRLVNIQILRGVAALLVLVAHVLQHATTARGLHLGGFRDVGAIGVDLFFVISGFVMAYSVLGRGGGADAREFLVLRFIRIAPPYWIASALFTVAALVLLGGGGDANFTLSFRGVLNTITFVPLFDAHHYSTPIPFAGWTLSFEFTFYLCVAAFVWFRRTPQLYLLALTFGALAVLGELLPPFSAVYLLHWVLNPIFVEFGFGIGAFYLWRSGWLARTRRLWQALGVLAVVVVALEVTTLGYARVYDANAVLDDSQSALRVLIWGLPAAAVFIAAIASKAWTQPRHAFAVLLGEISYSLYLIHPLAVRVVQRATVGLPLPTPLFIASMIAGGLVAGFLFHRIVERPLTTALRRRYERTTEPVPTASSPRV